MNQSTREATLRSRFAQADWLAPEVARVRELLPEGIPATFLPLQPIGISTEHVGYPGTLTLPTEVALRTWMALGESVARVGIKKLVMTGIATNIGVEMTAREAWQHNYSVVIAEDACATFSDEMHRFSMEKIMPRIARVRSTEAILAALPA